MSAKFFKPGHNLIPLGEKLLSECFNWLGSCKVCYCASSRYHCL